MYSWCLEPEIGGALSVFGAETLFSGRPLDLVFADRESSADYLTAYYTPVESTSLLVCVLAGAVKRYLFGRRRPLL